MKVKLLKKFKKRFSVQRKDDKSPFYVLLDSKENIVIKSSGGTLFTKPQEAVLAGCMIIIGEVAPYSQFDYIRKRVKRRQIKEYKAYKK